VTKFYALMEGPSHSVAVGPFLDYDRAGTWGIAHETADWTYRGSIALFSICQWLEQYGEDRR
jgi:hypothetical protein